MLLQDKKKCGIAKLVHWILFFIFVDCKYHFKSNVVFKTILNLWCA